MPKTIFGIDEIHNIRLAMAERFSHMTPEEARRETEESAARIQARIDEIRKMTPEDRAAMVASCKAACEALYADDDTPPMVQEG